MNKPLLIALAALLAGNVQAQNNPSYKVEVCFEDTQAGGKYVFRSSDLTDNFSDTLTLKKDGEKVVFKKEYTEPFTLTLSYIAPGEQRAGIAGNAFFIDGPLTIRIAGTQAAMLPAASVEGGVQDDPILQQIQPINAAMYTAFLDYQKLARTPDASKAEVDSLVGVLNQLTRQMQELQRQYIAARPQSIYSAALLSGMLREDPSVIVPLFEAFAPAVKESRYGKAIADRLAVIQAIQPGRPAPDFTLTDIDGKTLRLSDFRGKWVLLDFWGSWCIWCRKGNPALVELYQKYGGKDFEIIGLAARDREDNWKKAIAEDGLTWRHANLALNEGGNDLPAQYNVSGFPTKILIDPEGNISVISVGYHETDDPAAVKLIDALGETYVQ